MNKIVFICPYFGTLPKNHMDLWLQSCKMNSDITWLIFTDDHTKYNYPENVKVNYLNLKDMKEIIQKKFDFTISLERAYKLCDYKPAYGYIFSEYITNYDFWGYCDMSDCIFGDIRRFITDELLNKNEKIGFLGHLTLYKNSEDVNKRFMIKTTSPITYKDVFESEENMAFDELNPYSINIIYKENNIDFYRIDEYYYDISPLSYAFVRACYNKDYNHEYKKRIPVVFEWNKGRLFQYFIEDDKIKKEEKLYIHFQKRKMIKEFEGVIDKYFIVPNRFIAELDINSKDEILKVTKNKLYYPFFKLKFEALKYKTRKLIEKV